MLVVYREEQELSLWFRLNTVALSRHANNLRVPGLYFSDYGLVPHYIVRNLRDKLDNQQF